MKRTKILMFMAMIMLEMASFALADVLVSVSCPDSVYLHEVFQCHVTLYNDSSADRVITYRIGFDRGRAELLKPMSEQELNMPALTKKTIDVNVWAMETGSEAMTFEYGGAKIDSMAAKMFYVAAPPLRLELDRISLTAGKRNEIHTGVEGSGSFVSVEFKYPPGIMGTQRVDLGDVEDEKPVTLEITPDPYIIGTRTIDAYIRFTDDRGQHVLLQRIKASVSPSMDLLIAAIAVTVVLALVAFFLKRKSAPAKGGES